MRKMARFTMAVALAAGLVGLAVAQQRGGGFGGGFGTGPAQLINSKTVQADLKATEEQVTKLKEWAKGYQAKSMEMLKGIGKDTPPEERREKMAKFTEDTYKEIGTILDEKQVKRLKQIGLQVAGTGAYSQKDFVDALKITEDQTTKMREIQMASFKDRQDLNEEYGIKGFGGGFGKGGGTKLEPEKQKEFDKKSEAITKEVTTKIEAVLTDEQKKKFADMIGEKIDVAKVRQESTPTFGGGNAKKKKDD